MSRLRRLLNSLALYLRHGLFWTILRQRLLGGLPLPVRVRWEGARNRGEALVAMRSWGLALMRRQPGASRLLLLGDGVFADELLKLLQQAGAQASIFNLDCPEGWEAFASGCAGILCCSFEPREQMAAASAVATHPRLSGVPFEYVTGLSEEQGCFRARDEYADTWFISPILLDSPSPYEIYEQSLSLFDQKCGLRDFLDLYQMLCHVHRNAVPGDIAEFGSYRGHSGYLIARTLEALGSDKRLFLFDTFEEFPAEKVGVDYFWNQSHYVDFAEVQEKFRGMKQVALVRGDFTQTFEQSGIKKLSLAYIDCDSYRATSHMLELLWPDTLATGGVMICEDYGHPALLGNRLALHQQLDQRSGALRFFSQFSGLYTAVKL